MMALAGAHSQGDINESGIRILEDSRLDFLGKMAPEVAPSPCQQKALWAGPGRCTEGKCRWER
jgi:hypothetical protein